jgi:hypothetical protein
LKRPKRDPVREDRIHNEAIVDASPDEQAMSWYYYLESQISFPFQAKCLATKVVSPLRKRETVEVVRMAPDEACVRIPSDADQRSDLMAIAIPISCRSPFQSDGDHRSKPMPITRRVG